MLVRRFLFIPNGIISGLQRSTRKKMNLAPFVNTKDYILVF
jgi:hypothetical protein